jgi:hypothetical protein
MYIATSTKIVTTTAEELVRNEVISPSSTSQAFEKVESANVESKKDTYKDLALQVLEIFIKK